MNSNNVNNPKDEQPLVECVPNFSEGRDWTVIDAIVEAIDGVSGVDVLHVDIGKDTNRTVVTFIGEPAPLKEAAFRGIKKASKLIDMRKQSGAHPRMGATDVCPFVPVKNITMEECSVLAEEVAHQVGDELGISVFLYAESATVPNRKNLADIRRGEYEGMAEKLKNPEWRPDFGPTELNPKAGVTAIGAREFLIAYNINLDTKNVDYAKDIALELREKGRSVRERDTEPFYYRGKVKHHQEGLYFCGSCEFSAESVKQVASHTEREHGYDLYELLQMHGQDPENLAGKPVKRPGLFKYLKAIGWFVDEYDCAQVSMNLTNFRETGLREVYEKTKELASERGLKVTGSEIVGMAPYQALYEAGLWYREQSDLPKNAHYTEILEAAIQSLGLRDKTTFEIGKNVLGLPGGQNRTQMNADTTDKY
ncbi:MAG: glutamate formimidoyltransferase [Candidatus Marinimicrobia bacterium]|nr:glutamate formimidoyltransferase [Candidatus Neomarinimicrobiota bacterium]MCF7827532.1 glutamate formimidoyltransferase [Candidatus Neomarinimicrobiota bacterium]MCF7881606.1 glutamate formimidoyltransferase [Candidatus Neomarinimicrobiota bacterium]